MFLFVGEAKRWWVEQLGEKFQEKINAKITWDKFITIASQLGPPFSNYGPFNLNRLLTMENGDKHVKIFNLRLPLLKGAVEPQVVEDLLLRIEKIFNNMVYLEIKKVSLAVFLFEGEAKKMVGRFVVEKFQGNKNAEITWVEFVANFRAWSYTPHLIPIVEVKCYKFLKRLNRELRCLSVSIWIQEFFVLVEREKMIKIDLTTPNLAVPTSKKDTRNEPNKGRKSIKDKRSQCNDLVLEVDQSLDFLARNFDRKWFKFIKHLFILSFLWLSLLFGDVNRGIRCLVILIDI
ncbi:hypothetical protein IEQ34_003576 [Dendrobium chrysotoxum]|uniref:Uncharacterized protein n=1 Tax=Dendrobium chrysotoxum TaxID=161865 RepID=A0AAV7HM11_DENCH|nr:hypothetical protein IEQ34_003576 [Dendrobium chrysotoxum]